MYLSSILLQLQKQSRPLKIKQRLGIAGLHRLSERELSRVCARWCMRARGKKRTGREEAERATETGKVSGCCHRCVAVGPGSSKDCITQVSITVCATHMPLHVRVCIAVRQTVGGRRLEDIFEDLVLQHSHTRTHTSEPRQSRAPGGSTPRRHQLES
jgi:hypothetical protein